MAERIVSMHAAHRSGKKVVDGFLSCPSKEKYQAEMYPGAGHAFLNNPSNKNAVNCDAAAKSVAVTSRWLRKALA
jgi:dienelactone hydrolase